MIELDGDAYHSAIDQKNYDEQRVADLVRKDWYCIRIAENELNDKKADDLGSDYEKNIQRAYNKEFDDNWKKHLQLVLSPIAIARVKKTVIEALLTEKLDVEQEQWNILVKEHDVPCAALAFEDLEQMFNNITQLSEEYSHLKFPIVNLKIISTEEFKDSPLHRGVETTTEIKDTHKNYDLVIDISILRRHGIEDISFTEYKNCKNKCYFNIRSSHYSRSDRHIYTSDNVRYRSLVVKNNQGKYDDIEETTGYLKYFLQLIFRKGDFRDGQLPILNRALQNKSVIGLLPTGGGKSLTYQLASMLQPGVTLIVDPLKSLMDDQYRSLINYGIYSCTYINSIHGSHERNRREELMETSKVQFMFLSPERLCTYNFRERIKHMSELGVYFSYGVIDEVHCVSEWGHDFRTSYLHLGRNLSKYVKPKTGSLPLFGLTATASFDVLADVERELSGNNKILEPDSIIRYENINRLELQYRIEQIEADDYENAWGAITQDSVYSIEVELPDEKIIYCMAVTSPDQCLGTPSSWSGAVDMITHGRVQ